jgi:hypothetical protein
MSTEIELKKSEKKAEITRLRDMENFQSDAARFEAPEVYFLKIPKRVRLIWWKAAQP